MRLDQYTPLPTLSQRARVTDREALLINPYSLCGIRRVIMHGDVSGLVHLLKLRKVFHLVTRVMGQ